MVRHSHGGQGDVCQVCAICDQDGRRQQEGQKPFVVSSSQTVVDPHAMVVHPRDTSLAYAAVLASRRLQEIARRACIPRIVQHPVVWVMSHLVRMVEIVDVRLAVPLRAEIQEDIGLREYGEDDKYVVPSEQMPDRREEQCGACGDETEEEDYDGQMLLVHEVVAQTGATVRDAAIGELDVELAKRGGRVYDEKTVEEAYGCVSSTINILTTHANSPSYLNAGKLPKKATNVTSDTVTVNTIMLRARVIMDKVRYPALAHRRITGTKRKANQAMLESFRTAR
jgi:hypothetical protein